MAEQDYTFTEGIDPTSVFGVYTSVLLQLVREAVPNSYRGMIIFSDTTPDVTGDYAWHKRCCWINTNNWYLYLYNNDLSSWVNTSASIADGSINRTEMLADAIVTYNKLKGDGAPNVFFKVGADGYTVEFGDLVSSVGVGSLPMNKLVSIGPNAVVGVTTPAGTPYQVPFADVVTLGAPDAPNGVIPVAKLTSGSNGQVLTISGGVPVWAVGSASPGGAAGGDLAGTYPNPILANSGVAANTYGGVGKIPSIVVDSKGRITSASESDAQIPLAKIYYQLPAGDDGVIDSVGKIVALNNEVDPDGIVTLASNEMTLGAGTYEIEATARFFFPGHTGEFVFYLYDVTNAAVIDWMGYSYKDAHEITVILKGVRVTPAVSTSYVLKWEATTARYPTKNGQAGSLSPSGERYNQVIIRKLA